MSKYFAGIGSRETPPEIQTLMAQITEELCSQGYILRSGGAKGADTAFQTGAPEDQMEIYLDEMHPKKQCTDGWYNVRYLDNLDEAIELAEEHHPAWNRLGKKAKALIGITLCYNVGQIITAKSIECWMIITATRH